MKRSIHTALACLPWLLGTATAAVADSWACSKADLIRHVIVYYPDAPGHLPCEVFYSKPQENVVPRAIWKAANTEGYCQRKAAEFVARLEAWGWSCALDETEPVAVDGADRVAAPRGDQ